MKVLLNLSSNLFGDIFSHSQERDAVSVNVVPAENENKKDHIIILHGWGKSKEDMNGWVDYFKSTTFSKDKTIWNIGYPTGLKFTEAADLVLAFLEKRKHAGYVFENVYLVGYSMGGLVARQMVAKGFPVTKLMTICSPHGGINWYIPAVNPGVASLKQQSKEIEVLNQNEQEQKMRDRYLFCSVSFSIQNRMGKISHDGDTTLLGKSARGEGLGAEIQRYTAHVSYTQLVEPGMPHLEGMNPVHFEDILPFFTNQEEQVQQIS